MNDISSIFITNAVRQHYVSVILYCIPEVRFTSQKTIWIYLIKSVYYFDSNTNKPCSPEIVQASACGSFNDWLGLSDVGAISDYTRCLICSDVLFNECLGLFALCLLLISLLNIFKNPSRWRATTKAMLIIPYYIKRRLSSCSYSLFIQF